MIYETLSPLFALVFSNFFAVLFFLTILAFNRNWKELKKIEGLKNVVWASSALIFLWLFIFAGLQYTTAGNASIFLLMEILFSFLYFGLWHKEEFTKAHILGALVMATGALFVLFPGEFSLNKGDLLIIAGTAFGPIGNYFQQKARKQLSTETMLMVRNLITIPIIAILIVFTRQTIPSFEEFRAVLPWLIISGTVVFGLSKILWIEAIHRISVSKAVSLNTICPGLTLVFAYFLLNEIPTLWQIAGFVPMLIGAILITRK